MPSEKIQVAIDHPSSTFAAPPAIVGGALDDAGDIQNPIAPGGMTDDRQPGFHGQGTPGETIVIRDNGNEIGTTEVADDGTWTFTPSTDLLQGLHAITVAALDTNGNESAPSPAFNFEIDVTPPDASRLNVSGFTDNVGGVTGNVISGGTTDETRPLLSGISNGTPGHTVTVMVKDATGTHELGLATIGENGQWTFQVDTPLAAGLNTFMLVERDAAGNETMPTGRYKVTVNTDKPNAPVIDSVFDDVGEPHMLQQGEATNDARPTLAGTAQANHTVKFYDGSTYLGKAVADDDGKWSFTPQIDLPDGAYNITATSTSPVGQTSDASSAWNFVVDTTAPTQTATVTDIGKDSGFDADDYLTNDGSAGRLMMGQLSAPLAAGDTLQVSTDGGKTWKTAFVDGTQWSAQDDNSHAESWTVQTRVVDEAGNAGAVQSQAVTLDTVASQEPGSLTITGSANNSVTVAFDPAGVKVGDRVSLSNLYLRYEHTLTAEDVAAGKVTFSPVFINEGIGNTVANTNPIAAAILDAAGNLSARSLVVVENFDAWGGPMASADRGLVKIESLVAGKTFTVATGSTLSPLLADASNVLHMTSNVKLSLKQEASELAFQSTSISGTGGVFEFYNSAGVLLGTRQAPAQGSLATLFFAAPAGEAVSYVTYKNAGAGSGVAIDNLTVKHVDQSGWFSPNSVVASQDVNGGGGYYGTDGADVFTFSYPDASVWVKEGIQGNGGIDTLKLTKADQVLDLTALAGKLTSVEVIDITGTGNNTLTLSLAEVLENGTVDQFVANGRVQMMVKGNAGDAVSLLDLLPNGTDPGDWAQSANVTIDGVVYEVYQHSGFKADLLVQQGVTVTLQISIDRVMDDVGAITGAISKGGVTDDTTPTLNGKAAAGGTVKVYDGSTLLGSTVADAKGHWSFTPTTALSEGLHNLSATVTPVGGNEGARSAVFELTVDTTPPATAPTITGAYDDLGSSQGNVPSGGMTDDTRPTLSGTGMAGCVITVKNGNAVIGTTTVGSDGKWSLVPDLDLPLGNYSFVATQSDQAGNASSSSAPYNLGIGAMTSQMEGFESMVEEQLWSGKTVITPRGLTITAEWNADSSSNFVSTSLPNSNGEGGMALSLAYASDTRFDFGPEGTDFIQYRIYNHQLPFLTSGSAYYYDTQGAFLGEETVKPHLNSVISFTPPPGKTVGYMTIYAYGILGIDNIEWSTLAVPATSMAAVEPDATAATASSVEVPAHATSPFTDSDDTLIARLGFADRLEGGAGNDTLTHVGTGDTVHGGAGDDTIRINSGDFTRLDGGLGIDTLVMDGKAMHIDLSALGAKVLGFEKFDLGAGGNTLALSAHDLLAGGARDMVSADGKVQMLVNGANGDVNLLGGDDGWTLGNAATVGGVTYSVYTNLAGTAELLVEDKVHVTIL